MAEYSMNHSIYDKSESYKQGASVADLLLMILALVIIAWLNNGVFTFLFPIIPNVVRWGFFFLWLCLAFVYNAKFLKNFLYKLLPLLMFCLLILIEAIVKNDSNNVYVKDIIYLIMVSSIFLYYNDNKFLGFKKVIIVFLFFDYIFVAINTYIQLQINPYLSRFLSTSAEMQQQLLNGRSFSAIGNYGYFYSLVPLILLLGFMLLNFRNKKITSAVLMIGFTTLLIKSSFTIAIIFTFLFLLLIIILRLTDKHSYLLISLFVIILLLIFMGSASSFFINLSKLSWMPYEVSMRFKEISRFLTGGNLSESDFSIRIKQYLVSWMTFFGSPIYGTFGSNVEDYSIIGGHSAWPDLLAVWGILAVPFFVFLKNMYKIMIKSFDRNLKKFVNIYWIYFALLGFVNTVLFSNIFIMWFIFIPFAMSVFSSSTKECKDE